MSSLILASSSPRRAAILSQMGLSHTAVSPDVDESVDPALSPPELATRLAERKALKGLEMVSADRHRSILKPRPQHGVFVLAADTVVALGSRIMGKPSDRNEAAEFLKALSGRTHEVHTGVAIVSPKGHPGPTAACSTTAVEFADLADREVEWYLESGEWRGVAGGYRIQERGACLVASIRGSYSGVVGLPIRLVYSMLAANGFTFP